MCERVSKSVEAGSRESRLGMGRVSNSGRAAEGGRDRFAIVRFCLSEQ